MKRLRKKQETDSRKLSHGPAEEEEKERESSALPSSGRSDGRTTKGKRRRWLRTHRTGGRTGADADAQYRK